MLANYLIGLREGLEASLVVGILVAYIVKTGRSDKLGSMWLGTGIAVALSLSFGALLTFTSRSLSEQAAHAFAGTMSIIAVILVTWMVFWMRRTAREMRGDLHGKLEAAAAGGGLALVLVALVAVLREGLETALFLWAATTQSASTPAALIGALLGIATAVLIGWGVYRGSMKLNLATFFTWTGALLIIVAAGVLAYGVRDLQEAGILPGGSNIAFDVSATIPEDSALGTVLGGFFHFDPITTWLQLVTYVTYLIGTMSVYFLRKPTQTSKPVSSRVAEPVAH
jgi:high-affinity iron transporter